ncbi:MAG: hypothetical protein AAGJ93_15465, partial [Bacteroidota bacterium]
MKLLSLIVVLTYNVLLASNVSTDDLVLKRTFFELSHCNDKIIEGKLVYSNDWNTGGEIGPVWIFVKNTNGTSIAIKAVSSDKQKIEVKISQNSKGAIISPESNTNYDCIDIELKIEEDLDIAKIYVLEMVEVESGVFDLGTTTSFEK